MTSNASALAPIRRAGQFIYDIGRGLLMGVAEVLPGISGGTVALIIGIYERVVFSASQAVKGFVLLLSFKKVNWLKAREKFRDIDWSLLIPLLIGMIVAILGSSAAVYPLIIAFPTLTSASFAGLILASLVVPIKLSGGNWQLRHYLIAVLAASFAFTLTSLPRSTDTQPSDLLIFVSAALAICALSLPGVSGSNVLIAMGMFTPVLLAVNTLDFRYLGIFMLGAIVGFASFVGVLQWLLENRRKATFVVMTGLMFGSVRALWPWQTESGGLLPPTTSVIPEFLAFVACAVFVLAMTWGESRFSKGRLTS
jgi:putative membrane protein